MQDEGKGSGNGKISLGQVPLKYHRKEAHLKRAHHQDRAQTREKLVRSWSRQHHSMSEENWENGLLSSASDFKDLLMEQGFNWDRDRSKDSRS